MKALVGSVERVVSSVSSLAVAVSVLVVEVGVDVAVSVGVAVAVGGVVAVVRAEPVHVHRARPGGRVNLVVVLL